MLETAQRRYTWCNFGTGMNWYELQEYANILVGRMGAVAPKKIVEPMNAPVSRRIFHQKDPREDRRSRLEDPDYSLTIDKLSSMYRLCKPCNTYHSVEEVARVEGVGDTCSGIVKNNIKWKMLQGLDSIRHFTDKWTLTDTSAAATFGVYMEKVDTVTPADTPYDQLEEQVWDVLLENVPNKTFGMLSYEEGVARLRKNAHHHNHHLHGAQ